MINGGRVILRRDPDDAAACPACPAMAGLGPGGAARFGVRTRGTLY